MIQYPLTINYHSRSSDFIGDREIIEGFQEYQFKWIVSQQHFHVIRLRLENKKACLVCSVTFKNCLGFGHEDLHFDQLFKMEIRFGGTSYVHSEVMNAGYAPRDAERFADILIWDQTNQDIPKYRIVAEEIIITQEPMP
jgi:hypothetical protein